MATEKLDNFSTRLRDFRKKVGLSQEEAGAKLGVTGDYISQIETGRKTASSSLRLLLSELERSPLYPRQGSFRKDSRVTEEPPSDRKVIWIPLISWAQAGMATAFETIPEEWQERIPAVVNDQTAFAITVRGDSMEPRFQEGDAVIVLPRTAARNGDLVIANIKEEGFAFKILTLVGGDPARVKLTSYNQAYPPMEFDREQFNWIYPVHSVNKVIRR